MTVNVLGKGIEITDKTALKAYEILNGTVPSETGVLATLCTVFPSFKDSQIDQYVRDHSKEEISTKFTEGVKLELAALTGNNKAWNDIKEGRYPW